jgi:hypothetical protein
MDSQERAEAFHELQRLGVIDYMEIAECKAMLRAESEPSEFQKAASEMLQREVREFDERTSRIKYKKCPECHGEGKRYVTTCISLRQGNFRRSDGSYHFDKDGTEREAQYEWKTCPDCKGTGKVRA